MTRMQLYGALLLWALTNVYCVWVECYGLLDYGFTLRRALRGVATANALAAVAVLMYIAMSLMIGIIK